MTWSKGLMMEELNQPRESAQYSPPPCQPLPGVKASFQYPTNRRSFFAIKYIRRLGKEAYANRIGPEACWLLATIALQEDEVGYSRPVDFYNGQIMDRCGIADERALQVARKACIDAGLLHYVPSTKRTAGLYWVIVPTHWEPFDGEWRDDRDDDEQPAGPRNPLPQIVLQKRRSNCGESVDPFEGNVPTQLRGMCRPSIPIPVPVSTPIPSIPGPVAAAGVWNDLVERLKRLGLGKAKLTIHEARRKGLAPEYVTAVMDYYEAMPRNAFNGVGVIDWRLTNDVAITFPAVEGWPAPKVAVVQQAKVDRMVHADRLKTQVEAQSSAERKQREDQLLLRFNDRLSAMTPAEIQQLADENLTLKESLKRCGAGSRTFRVMMARHLSQVAEPPR